MRRIVRCSAEAVWTAQFIGRRENSLAVAWEHGCRTVAFPSISTGVYHFPLEQAADIAVQTIAQFLQTHPDMERVTMVCFDRATYQAYERAVKRL